MIYFPGVGLALKINSVAFCLFGIEIYWYAICIVFGITLALTLAYFTKDKFGIPFSFVFETMIFAILLGFVGARIYYVAFHLKEYMISPVRIFQLRDGGLAIYGGLIIGAIVIIVRCQKYKISSLDFLDYFVPFVSLAQAIGRWGNFFNKEAYGEKTTNVFRMGIDTVNGYQEVHPTFLYESLATFLIFLFLKKLQKSRRFKGQIFYLYLFCYGAVRMLIENLRMDSLMFKNLRISQILSVAIFVISSIMLLKNYRKYILEEISN